MNSELQQAIQQAREQGALEAKIDTLMSMVKDLDSTVHGRIDNTNNDVKELDRKTDGNAEDISHIKGGIKVLWGIALLGVTLLSGIAIKVFFG